MERLKGFLRLFSRQNSLALSNIGEESFWKNWIGRYEEKEVNHWRKKAQELYEFLQNKENLKKFIEDLKL